MNRITRTSILVLVLMTLAFGIAHAQENVTITYWQYDYASKVIAIDTLIEQFEAENPGIKVIHETFPYDAYNQKVATSVPAGQGPDVINLYYGWIPVYARSGYLQPLPEEHFPIEEIESEFAPMVQEGKFDGKYWGLPTAVRTLGLIYNKNLFDGAGFAEPPSTWSQLVEYARKLTIGSGPTMTQSGYAPGNQKQHLWREVLVRHFGGTPFSEDGRTVTYNTQGGVDAFAFYSGLITEEQVGLLDFFPGYGGYSQAFMAGRVGMIVEGSFGIGNMRAGASMPWGVAELPTSDQGEKANYGSFWLHGITRQATGEKLDAAIKFLKYITSAETMRYWMDQVGELPARTELAADPALLNDPEFGPFVAAVPYSYTTMFVDETAQRQVFLDALNRVVLEGQDVAEAVAQMAAEEQSIIDEFWND